MEGELLKLVAGGADATIIFIGILLMRVDRRLTRVEFKVFGFDLGAKQGGK